MGLPKKQELLGDTERPRDRVALHIAEMLECKDDPVNGGHGQREKLGQLRLGGTAGSGGEGLKKSEPPLEGGRMGDSVDFHW